MKQHIFRALLLLLCLLLCAGALSGCQQSPAEQINWNGMQFESSMELAYADQFAVDYTKDGYARIAIGGTDTYLLVPENAPVPAGLPDEVTVLQQPLDHIYLVATSAMDFFRELDGLDAIRLSGTDAAGWYIPQARQAIEDGSILYAGKYSAPDYELILSQDCDLALESTMIYHTPEVMEQLEKYGIPVLIDRSSYESHPLGRMEWLKLYAALLDREDAADAYFDRLSAQLTPVLEQLNTGKTVAFFAITSNGAVNVRKSGDYISKSIALAGGAYIFPDLTSNGNDLSTMNMQMEAFYAGARDADILIYNSAIDSELQTIDQLLAKSPLLKDFRAVQTGNVWCTGKNLYQESLGLGGLITDLHTILTAEAGDNLELTYLHRLQ